MPSNLVSAEKSTTWQNRWTGANWARMGTSEAIGELRSRCNELALLITAMHPTAKQLGNPSAQGEVLKALFELTKQVEVVKKQLLRLEKQDDSTVL